MNRLQEKLKLIYIPFLLIAFTFVAVYSLLNWGLFIRLEVITVKEDIVNFWLPFALPWVPILIWLRPRLKLLHFNNDNASFVYQFFAALAIAFPTIVTQEYLSSATGKLTTIENISRYDQQQPTKYYALKKYYVDKVNIGVVNTATVSGKRNETLNLLIYIALPLLSDHADTLKRECSYFIGKKYLKSISNNLSNAEKEEAFKSFATKSQEEYDTTAFNKFVYLEKLGHSVDHDEFEHALKKSDYVRYKDPIVFKAHTDAFEKRNGGKFGWIFKAFGIGALVWFILLLFPKLDAARLNQFKEGVKQTDTDYKEMLDLFIPKKNFYITPIIMNLNIIIYLVLVFAGFGWMSFKGIDLLQVGANFRPATTNGQWWRLLTSVFLHGGLLHLFANMIGLVFVGVFLEPLLGWKKYMLVYLVTGILASCASLWWYPATISVGASGAIFGLYGLFIALLVLKVFPAGFTKAFLVSTLLFIGYNLVMGLSGGIDNAAHIGGLVSGCVIGIALTPSLRLAITEEQQDDNYIS